MKKIRIGSRDSLLAVVQAELIAGAIARAHPEIEIEIVTMKTAGDLNMAPFDRLSVPGLKGGAKGLFVKELEQALVDGRVDLAVHSLKDVPMEQDERLPIVALGSAHGRDGEVVNEQQIQLGQLRHAPRIAAVAVGDLQFAEQARRARVEHRET